MQRVPARLHTQTLFKVVRNNMWWSTCEYLPQPYRLCQWNMIQDLMNGQFTEWFDFEVVDDLQVYKHYDMLNKESVCEGANTWDAFLDSEQEKIWFYFLKKYVDQGILAITIPMTIHQYEQLYNMDFFNRVFKCGTSADLSNLLLMLSGDVESNPGPSYKDTCRLVYKKKQNDRKIYTDKNMRRMNLDLKGREINDDFKYVIDEGKKVAGSMQILGLVTPLVGLGSSIYLGNKTRTFMNKANTNMDILTEQITETLKTFRGLVTDENSILHRGINMVKLIGDLIFGLLQVSMSQPSKRLYSLGLEIFRILTSHGLNIDLLDSIKTCTKSAFEKIKVYGSMQIDGIEHLEYLTPTHVCMFFFSILSLVFTGFAPKATSIEILIKRLGDISRSTKNIMDFNNATHSGLQFVLNEVKKTLGLRPTDEVELFISGIDRWFDEVRSFLQREEEWKKSDQILKDPAYIIELENLYRRGLEFSREISDKKLQRELTMPFNMHMKYVTELMKQVDTSGAFGTKPRTQPVVIWLFGESGVGKSGMSWPLAIDLNNVFVHNEEEAKEFSKNIYMRNVEQEFWDNYQGQNVVIYDDFGQRVDSQQKPNEEFMELIRTANIAPYPLHMAHLEDKRKTRFTSKILLMTSNVFEQNVSSLTFPDAFRRRIDLCARVTNYKEYTKSGYSTQKNQNVQRLDKKKVQEEFGEIISTAVYDIDLVDPESGATIQKGLTYEDFYALAAEKTRDAFESSQKMNDFLERYATRRFKENKIPGKMQIDIDEKFAEAIDWTMCQEETVEQILAYADQNLLVDAEGKKVTVQDIEENKPVEFLESNVNIDYNTWLLYNLRETCFKKANKVYDLLVKAKNYAKNKLIEWKDKFVAWVKTHPYTIACGLLGTLITVLTISKFWNKFFSHPPEHKKLAEYTFKNTTIKLYEGQEGIDVRQYDQAGILSIIPKVINDTLFQATKAFIMKEPYPLVLSVLQNLGLHVTIYSVKKILNIRGRKLELSQPDLVIKRPVVEAKTSADPTTLAPKKVVIEAKCSADPTTLSTKKVVLEAKCSADPTTISSKKAVMEASSSADPTTLRQRSRVLEGNLSTPAEMQVWKDQAAQTLITNRIFSNLYKICRVINDTDSMPLLHGLFVKGNIMLVPSHLTDFVDDSESIEIINCFETSFQVPWKEIKKIRLTNAIGEEKEATLLVFPNYIPQHSDIVKHFSDADAMGLYKRAEVCLPLLRYSQKVKKFLINILGNTEAIASDVPITIMDADIGKDYIIREGLYYKSNTTNGDCGAPLVVNETQVLRKIAGIHVAGDYTGMAYSESVTQKDLERAFVRIPANMQISLDLDSTVKLHDLAVPFNEEIDAMKYMMVPSTKFQPLGTITPIFEAGKTELRKSLIHGMIQPLKTKPAKLRNYIENGNYINIKHKNLGKAAMDTPFLDPEMLSDATLLVKQKWLQNMRPELRRILTFEEAIKGNTDSEYISPINRRSSPGYPWILQRTKGKPGKTGWFGDEEYVINEDVELAVKNRIELAKKGIRTPTMWVDTLKDERRPIAKVDAGKTRVFSNGPMDFSIAFRQYFLGFVAHLMENRITNEVSLGTNVYSRDWTKTARKLQSRGKKTFAGDFSTFDGTLNSSMMFKFLDIVNSFYNDGEENALIRYVLFSEVVNSVHICDDLVYYMTHSQPSGNPVTTPLNCFVNSVGGRMCFEIAARKHKSLDPSFKTYSMYDFDRHVSLVSYGDDNVYNISDEVSEWFNMHTITEAFAELGMIYTDETKDITKVPPKYKPLEEVSYLKRGFSKTTSNRWLAPLDIGTILEMPNWCRGGLDIHEGTKVNCENAIMELAMHPEEVYDKWTKIISEAFLEKTGDMLEYKSYRGYNLSWLEEYFC